MAELTPTARERQWAALAHLLTFLGYAVFIGSFVPPLVVWMVHKDESEFVAEHAKQALNFQINVLAAGILGAILVASAVFACVGIPYLIVLAVAQIVFVIVAAVRAHEGRRYRYPVGFQVIR